MNTETLAPTAGRTPKPDPTPTPIESTSAAEARSRKSLDDRIEEAEVELKRLKEARRQKETADRERNERDLRALLAAEKLNLISASVWRQALPEIKAVLARATAA